MVTARLATPRVPRMSPTALVGWLRRHDPDFNALRKAVRAALVMPATFAFADAALGNPTMGTFAAFGSFAMLLLVEFAGPIRERVIAQASLGVACAILIALGTLASQSTAIAALAMAIVGFVVLFSGIVSAELAGARTPLLLAFILPVTFSGADSTIPDRVLGWGLAAALSVLAIALLWPASERNPVRDDAIETSRAIARRLRADVAYLTGPDSEATRAAHRAAGEAADAAVQTLYKSFFATAYRPAGLSTDARALVRLVDELRWCNAIARRTARGIHLEPDHEVCTVKRAAADVLDRVAESIAEPRRSTQLLRDAETVLRDQLTELEQATTARLPARLADHPEDGVRPVMISSFDPSFRAQELSFIVAQIAANTRIAAMASCRTWTDRLLGRQPEELGTTLAAALERLGAQLTLDSVWLQSSLRGGIALGAAVLVADLSSVEHGFWVAFGTLSVLRSNALSTGQDLLRAILGTTVGFVIGGALVYFIGTNTAVLWTLLPVAILLAGLAPATISFAAGQAAFTATLLILFNLIAPAGWKLGIVRIEDIALGGGVSLAVGLLFWPRGAAAALRRSLADAYARSTDYLASAVAFGVGRCDTSGPALPPPQQQAFQAAAASRRLDNAFREYLIERGAKVIPLAEVTRLVVG